jgi:hypothetical protein
MAAAVNHAAGTTLVRRPAGAGLDGQGDGGRLVVNRGPIDRLPNVVREGVNLGFLLPRTWPPIVTPGRRLANWRNSSSAWIRRGSERCGPVLALISESEEIGICHFGWIPPNRASRG